MFVTNLTRRQTAAQAHSRALVVWPWMLMALAWALALAATLTNQQYLINHEYLLEESQLPVALALFIFLACWQVMTVGMMLPSSLPFIRMMAYASQKQRRSRVVQAAFLAGYALVWTAFAVAAFMGDAFIHQLVDSWPWLAAHAWIIGASTFTIAGVFQFSPLKERCLKACNTPFGFFARYYRQGVGAAWRLGLRHGMFCLGCCWALMLVMFGVGVGNLAWMAALAGVMTIEKAVPGGRRLSPVVGIVMLLLAVLWVVHPAWLVVTG